MMNIWRRRIIFLVTAYLAQRLLFWLFNQHALAGTSPVTLGLAMIDGFRFDLCIIATLNVPIMLIHGLRYSTSLRQVRTAIDHGVGVLFALVNVPLIVLGIVDCRMFSFTGRRISLDLLAIGGDIKGQSLSILIQYWFVTIPGLTAIALFILGTWQFDHDMTIVTRSQAKRRVPVGLGFALVSFLLIRGGWQTKPLAPAHAFKWQPAAVANFVLNTGMTILRTPPSTFIPIYHDFPSMNYVRRVLAPTAGQIDTLPLAAGKNVVVIIVESLAAEYVGFLNDGKGYTPFLDELSRSSVTFHNSFASGRRSIDAMPSIFAGIPAWRDQPFVTSPYASNTIVATPSTLARLGYHSVFLHGGANGTMHFDVFSKMAGFDQYIGRNEYPNEGDDDGQWGIFDEPFLLYAAEKFTEMPTPFFAGIFTLSSHNPFKVPDKYSGRFPKGTLPIHESIGYVDYALSEFFRKAANLPWFSNTLFVITGDHTSLSDDPKYNNLPGHYRVPILFYDPTGSLPRVSPHKYASHIDITPTVLELLGASSKTNGLFGGPLFDRRWSGHFIQQEYDTWYYCDEMVQVSLDGGDHTRYFAPTDWDWLHPLPPPVADDFQHRLFMLKAARQYFSNGLIENSWYR